MADENHEVHERLARIEVRVDHLDAASSRRDKQIDHLVETVDDIDEELSRYRGFVGGVLLVVTALMSFFKFFWDDIVRFFTK